MPQATIAPLSVSRDICTYKYTVLTATLLALRKHIEELQRKIGPPIKPQLLAVASTRTAARRAVPSTRDVPRDGQVPCLATQVYSESACKMPRETTVE